MVVTEVAGGGQFRGRIGGQFNGGGMVYIEVASISYI